MPSKMKNIISKDLFCSSPSSTAICSSIDQRTMVRNGLKPLHRLDSNLNNHYKTLTNNIYNFSSSSKVPCVSELPFTPRPHHRLKTEKLGSTPRRKSSADVSDLRKDIMHRYKHNTNSSNISTGYSSPTPVGHSSRYLLGDSEKYFGSGAGKEGNRSPEKEVKKCRSEKKSHWSLIDTRNDDDKVISLGVVKVINNDGDYKKVIKSDNNSIECGDYGQRQKIMGQCKAVKSSANARARDYGAKDQVVVLRVSLHCKCRGCEAKLRKHLSKMQGVTSFSIDLEVKKVTVVGNVSPLDVLTSISKVKNAQFWPSPTSSSSTTSSSSSTCSTLDLRY